MHSHKEGHARNRISNIRMCGTIILSHHARKHNLFSASWYAKIAARRRFFGMDERGFFLLMEKLARKEENEDGEDGDK